MDKIEIKKDIKNEMLSRREVQVIVEAEKTPSFAEASKLIAGQFKAPEENIMIERVNGKFGRKTFMISGSIYDTKESREEAFKRLTKPKKAKPGEAPAA